VPDAESYKKLHWRDFHPFQEGSWSVSDSGEAKREFRATGVVTVVNPPKDEPNPPKDEPKFLEALQDMVNTVKCTDDQRKLRFAGVKKRWCRHWNFSEDRLNQDWDAVIEAGPPTEDGRQTYT
jgi:hypothetical protein